MASSRLGPSSGRLRNFEIFLFTCDSVYKWWGVGGGGVGGLGRLEHAPEEGPPPLSRHATFNHPLEFRISQWDYGESLGKFRGIAGIPGNFRENSGKSRNMQEVPIRG